MLGGALLQPLAACSSDEAGGTTVARRGARAAAGAATEASSPPVIAEPTTPYAAREVLDDGWVTGTVQVAGSVPQDTVVTPTMDQRVCGTRFTDETIRVRDGRLADAVVWLTDVRSGKALPLRRRYTVDNVDCRIEPRVQAVVAGGTLNLRSDDRVVHRTRILRQDGDSTLAIVQHNDFGQVVPDDQVLARPGLLELRSDVHPWTRGWIAVFDHPYFAVTGRDGAFTMEEVPPGQYTLAAWHERFGRLERPVTVTAGDRTPITITFGDSTRSASDSARGVTGDE